MLRRLVLLGAAVAAATTLAAGVTNAIGAKKPVVKAPKSGKYPGATATKRPLTLYISGKQVLYVTFEFACNKTVSATSGLQSIALKRTDKGYKFSIAAHGIVSYHDGEPEQNGAIRVSGQFTRSGKTVTGRIRVRTPRCPTTNYVDWHARRPATSP
jgi:hypothetical protein